MNYIMVVFQWVCSAINVALVCPLQSSVAQAPLFYMNYNGSIDINEHFILHYLLPWGVNMKDCAQLICPKSWSGVHSVTTVSKSPAGSRLATPLPLSHLLLVTDRQCAYAMLIATEAKYLRR